MAAPLRPRDESSAIRMKCLLDFCSVPRSKDQIRAEFGNDERWMFAVHNAVKQGRMVNKNHGMGRRYPGLFVATGTVGKSTPPAAVARRIKLASEPPDRRRVASVWQLGEMA